MVADAWRNSPGGIQKSQIPAILGQEQAIAWLNQRILGGLEEEEREIIECALLLREFNIDALAALLEKPHAEVERRLRRLHRLSFIRPRLALSFPGTPGIHQGLAPKRTGFVSSLSRPDRGV